MRKGGANWRGIKDKRCHFQGWGSLEQAFNNTGKSFEAEKEADYPKTKQL